MINYTHHFGCGVGCSTPRTSVLGLRSVLLTQAGLELHRHATSRCLKRRNWAVLLAVDDFCAPCCAP